MLITLYGPKPRESKKIVEAVTEGVTPVIAKVETLASQFPRPFRGTLTQLIRNLKILLREARTVENLDNKMTERLIQQSPEWMKTIIVISNRGLELGTAAAKRSG